MKRLSVALLAAGMLATPACSPASDSAFGQRPTSYPAVGTRGDLAPQGSVDDDLVALARTTVETALTYDHRTYADDTIAAQQLMTPAFARSWGEVAGRLRPATAERGAHVDAAVVDAGLSAATARRAEVLLFVDRTLRSAAHTEHLGGIAVATLANNGSRWLLDDLRLTPPQSRVTERRPVPATVLAAATAVADAWTDLSSEHPHADVARVLSLTTGPLRREYGATAPELVERTLAADAVQEGRVIAVALAHLGKRTARALAAVESSVSVAGAAPTRRLLRIELELVRTRSAWLARSAHVVPAP